MCKPLIVERTADPERAARTRIAGKLARLRLRQGSMRSFPHLDAFCLHCTPPPQRLCPGSACYPGRLPLRGDTRRKRDASLGSWKRVRQAANVPGVICDSVSIQNILQAKHMSRPTAAIGEPRRRKPCYLLTAPPIKGHSRQACRVFLPSGRPGVRKGWRRAAEQGRPPHRFRSRPFPAMPGREREFGRPPGNCSAANSVYPRRVRLTIGHSRVDARCWFLARPQRKHFTTTRNSLSFNVLSEGSP